MAQAAVKGVVCHCCGSVDGHTVDKCDKRESVPKPKWFVNTGKQWSMCRPTKIPLLTNEVAIEGNHWNAGSFARQMLGDVHLCQLDQPMQTLRTAHGT